MTNSATRSAYIPHHEESGPAAAVRMAEKHLSRIAGLPVIVAPTRFVLRFVSPLRGLPAVGRF